MALTAIEIRNAKAGAHADGGGLYLVVKNGGTKSWIFRYQIAKRRREMGLGPLPAVSAVDARAEAARLLILVRQGIDPLELRAAQKRAAEEQHEAEQHSSRLQEATFRRVAEDFIASQESGWRNPKHHQQWLNTLATYVYPVMGDMAVSAITTEHILQVLKPLWSTKPETASRVRMRMEAVLNAAKVRGLREGDNPAVWRGGLEAVLPPMSRVRKVRHHPAMDWQAAPKFYQQLVQQEGKGARALIFVILTAARSGEARKATWDEIDLEAGVWTVPAERMKAGKTHRVALSPPAIELLRQLPKVVGCPWVFPGMRNQPLSDMTLSAVLKRMGLTEVTVHGFRSTFRDWAAEETAHHPETVEMALAHTVSNAVERAYRRGDQLEKRRRLMDDWACWLIRSGSVDDGA